MAWGSLTVGRVLLSETPSISHQVNASSGVQGLTLEGLQSTPPLTRAQVRARQEDLMAMLDRDLPLVFSNKDNHTGFYRVSDIGTRDTYWAADMVQFFPWNLTLTRIGTDNSIDMESRLASVVRLNDFALSGERWHAPAPGAYAYWTGFTQPGSSVSRPLANGEGSITVYRAIPAGVHPRWGISAPNYLRGRVRLHVAGQERSGIQFRVSDAADWELSNGVVRVRPRSSGGLLDIGVWDGPAWSDKAYDVVVGSAITPPFDAVTVLRNDFECVVIRLVKSKSPGRTLLDLTLRRGSRFVEGYLSTDASATLGFQTQASVTTTNNAASGYIVASGDDADGNRIAMGAPRAFTGSTTGAISKAASTSLAFWAGVVLNGSAPAAGDAATDLRNQYIGALAEQVQAVKR